MAAWESCMSSAKCCLELKYVSNEADVSVIFTQRLFTCRSVGPIGTVERATHQQGNSFVSQHF